MRAKIANARSRSRGVVLDAGLQYPPARVFSLPGGTRFLDQFGDVYTGPAGSGNNIANAVTNPAVRAAEADYLRALSALIPGDLLGAVRTAGGPQGQLSYPTGKYQGHQDFLGLRLEHVVAVGHVDEHDLPRIDDQLGQSQASRGDTRPTMRGARVRVTICRPRE